MNKRYTFKNKVKKESNTPLNPMSTKDKSRIKKSTITDFRLEQKEGVQSSEKSTFVHKQRTFLEEQYFGKGKPVGRCRQIEMVQLMT